ncbi:hypothetical protein [Coleofasciculus sp. H7-2]|uniref:hypothetical protein n=1 Tax=Coleofasciculus sp. H7-2 TaxID=3351545 RepID=UPI00366D33A0
MAVESLTESLTEVQWQIAHAIAQTLATDQLRINKETGKNSDGIATELKKTVTYLYANQDQPNARAKFFTYLKTLVGHGLQIGHSGKTPDYYHCIEKACKQHLPGEQANPRTMLLILGWSARLVRYHKETVPIGEIATPSRTSAIKTPTPPVESHRQTEIKAVTQSQTFQLGQTLDAEVTNIKGKEVTYTILEKIKLTVKEPKKYEILSVGKTVRVEVTELKKDGSPKKVKSVE